MASIRARLRLTRDLVSTGNAVAVNSIEFVGNTVHAEKLLEAQPA
jgi:hypothetical protein